MYKLKTAPTAEPVTYAQVKTVLKLSNDDEQTHLELLIAQARQYVEKHTNRSLVEQTWQLFLDEFPSDNEITITRVPVREITSVTYYDENDSSDTLTVNTDYIVDKDNEPARIVLEKDSSWPDTYERPNAVIIEFIAGQVATESPTTVDAIIRGIIIQLVVFWYNNPGDEGHRKIPSYLIDMLDTYKMYTY